MIVAWLGLALAADPVVPSLLWAGCTWTDAPFEHTTAVSVPGASEPVVDLWGNDRVWVTAQLGQDYAMRPAFAAVWSSHGVSVAGYADLRDTVVLRLSGDTPVSLGPTGHLVVGASLQPFAFVDGTPLVRAHPWALEHVKRGPGYAKVPCERLSVTRGAWLDEPDIVAAVFGPDLETELVPAGTRLKLHDVPDGTVMTVLDRLEYERTVWVVKRGDGWTHVALPDWTGALWHGWVNDLPEPDGDIEGGGGLGMLGGGEGGRDIPMVTCPDERVLWVRSAKRRLPLGSVDPGVSLEVLAEGASPAVQVPGYWLGAREGWWFELDADGCARSVVQAEPPGKLGALLGVEPGTTEVGAGGAEAPVVEAPEAEAPLPAPAPAP